MWPGNTIHVHMSCGLRICKKSSSPPCKFQDKIREFWTVHTVIWLLPLLKKNQLWALVAQFKLFTPSVCLPTMTTHIDVSKAKKLKVVHLQSAFTSMDFLVDFWLACHGTMPPRVASAWLHFLLARHIPEIMQSPGPCCVHPKENPQAQREEDYYDVKSPLLICACWTCLARIITNWPPPRWAAGGVMSPHFVKEKMSQSLLTEFLNAVFSSLKNRHYPVGSGKAVIRQVCC